MNIQNNNLIVFDIETKSDKLKEANEKYEGLGISCCVTYSYQENKYRFFGDTKYEHIKILEYLNGKTCIGFNIMRFDDMILLGNNYELLSDGTTKNKKYGWKNIDIFTEIFKAVYKTTNSIEALSKYNNDKRFHKKGMFNLESILKNTMGNMFNKNGDGKDAPELWKNKKTKQLFEYCLQDVRCERTLYEFCKTYKRIVNGTFDVVEFGQYNLF